MPSSIDLAPLRSDLVGTAVADGDDGWDGARAAWNLATDQRPAGVVLAKGADDVVAAVNYARDNGLRVTVQGTGHAAAALKSLDGVLLVKTQAEGTADVDPDARTARVEAGALAGDVCASTGAHRLTPLSGSSPDVGVVGFTLGGGLGWLSRRYGLAANHVTAMEVVTADGELVRVDADSNPDLFWALRGGGGSFGAVTALEIRLEPIAEVFAGGITFPAAAGAELMHAYREWVQTVPDEMSSGIRYLTPPPIPEVPEPIRGVPLADITISYCGDDPAEGEALIEPLRAAGEPILDTCSVVPAASLCRIYGDPEQPVPGHGHHGMLAELTSDTVDALVELAGPDSNSPLLQVALRHLGGALGTAPEGAGALGALEGDYALHAVGMLMDPSLAEPIDAHLDQLVDGLATWGTGQTYLNFMERPADASGAFDSETYRRLQEVKAQVDPEDLFLGNHPVSRP